MELVKLDIPAGIVRHGTELESKGRWHDSNLVRWDNGMPEPIGGWQSFSGVTEGANLITGSPFTTPPTGWTYGSMWVWSGSTGFAGSGDPGISLSGAGTPGSAAYTNISGSLTEGRRYRMKATVTSTYGGSTGVGVALLLNGMQSQTFYITAAVTYIQADFTLATVNSQTGFLHISRDSLSVGFNSLEVVELTDQTLDNANNGYVRGAHSWNSQSGSPYLGFGTFNSLRVANGNKVIFDVTPGSMADGIPAASEQIGYGSKAYGAGIYGVPRERDYTVTPATNWTLDNWGENLVAVSDTGQIIYELDQATFEATPGTVAAAVSGAPLCKSLVVTDERFLFALGAAGNPRQVQWSDREANTIWSPSLTNEAGDFELQTEGRIVCAERVRGRTLILTTRDAFVATYQGPPTVYGFQKVGGACGVAGRNLSCSVGQMAYWMGQDDFFVYDGSQARVLPCDVRDFVFNEINRDAFSHAYCVSNQKYGEVWWVYPGNGQTENGRYVYYSYRDGHWGIGEIYRSAGVDAGVFDWPIHWSAEYIYQHEFGLVHSDIGPGVTFDYPPFLESAPINFNEGDKVFRVMELIPEEANAGDCTISFSTKFYPNTTTYNKGPYALSSPTSLRFTARQVKLRIDARDGANWRIGDLRLRVRQGGRR